MSKLNKFLIVVTIILVLVTVGLVFYMFVEQNRKVAVYSAVYLESGDIYFGKLHIFPRIYLTNVYLLQKNNDPQTNNIVPYILSKFINSTWGPEDYLTLNRNKITWISQLRSDSTVVKAIDNPSAYTIAPTTTVPSTTTTFKK